MTEVAECKVSLWLSGDMLDPDALARSLGCAPAFSIRKGEAYQRKDGEEMVASTGRFQLTTGWRTKEALEPLICELMNQVPHEPAFWTEITATLSGKVVCGIILDSVNEETRVSAATLSTLGQRGLSLHFDIYDSGDGPIS